MLLLRQSDMESVCSMKDAIDFAKRAFQIYSRGESHIPLRLNIDIPEHSGQTLIMPGYIPPLSTSGLKIVSVYPNNPSKGKPSTPATMLLLDATNGEVSAILDGTYLTRLRTGAAAGAATDILACPNATIGALIGTGGQAASQLEAMLSVRKLKSVRVFAPNRERLLSFIANARERFQSFGVDIIAAETASAAITGADIITTVTTSKNPTFDGSLVKTGAHVNSVGSYTHEMQELDEHLITRAQKVIVDSREAALAEAGDLLIPMNKGLIDISRINGELGEVIDHKCPGRSNPNEITIFKTVGLAVLDLVTAKYIVDAAWKKQKGTQFTW